MSKKTRILLIGGNGQLGSVLRERFHDDEAFFSLSKDKLDITNKNDILQRYNEIQPELVINCSAYTAVDQAETDEETAFAVNCLGVENLVKALPLQCKLIHISTDFVFDGTFRKPRKTEDITRPVNIYGLSKRCGEKRIIKSRNTQYLIIRTSWLYSERKKNFVLSILSGLHTKNALHVVDDQIGSPTSVYSLARLLKECIKRPEINGIYHWSDKGEISWHDFAVEIRNIAMSLGIIKREIPIYKIKSNKLNLRAVRPAYSVMDCSKTVDIFKLEQIQWKTALLDIMEKMQEQVVN